MHRPDHESVSPSQVHGTRRCHLAFPSGLFGFESAKDLTLVQNEEDYPFGWLESQGDKGPSFLVVQPKDLGHAYQPEISREDAVELGLGKLDEALILAVVTQHEGGRVTLNLKSPIVINLKQAQGRQIIPRNISSFTSQYPLATCPA